MSKYFDRERAAYEVEGATRTEAHTQFLQVRPGGKCNTGHFIVDFDAEGVEYILLDEIGNGHYVYRTIAETINGDWTIGDLEDLLDCAVAMDEAIEATYDEDERLTYNE